MPSFPLIRKFSTGIGKKKLVQLEARFPPIAEPPEEIVVLSLIKITARDNKKW